MQMERRLFIINSAKGMLAIKVLGVATLGGAAISMSGCDQATTIAKVLKILPTVQGIVDVAGTIVETADPAIALPVTASLGVIDASFKIIQGVLTTYESNLATAPAGVIGTIDNAISSIETEITNIESFFPNLSPLDKAGIQVALESFETILGYIASLLPAAAASATFPKAYASLAQHKHKFGVAVSVPSKRDFAKSFNSNIDAAGWKGQKHVHISVPIF